MAYVYFGNLSVNDLESRLGIQISNKDKCFLESVWVDKTADVRYNTGTIHIYDLPFCIQCSKDIFTKVKNIMQKYSDDFQFLEPLQIIEVGKTKEDEDNERREAKRKKEKEIFAKKTKDPNKRWLAKYIVEVPIPVKLETGETYKMPVEVMINMNLLGFNNAPKYITGKGYLLKDDRGWYSEVYVDKSCQNENFYADDKNYGVLFYTERIQGKAVDRIDFDIKECLDLYESKHGASLTRMEL